ncbi:CYTH domain-containing protein [Microbacterium luticocti]|uniref:CYTH domain-containing protein n=1 Tax=Microbacterium luticocti TaxID=451764 RepID=UPI00041CE694|nr:CYTH domain-containing protein [Microbacterium luticocti]
MSGAHSIEIERAYDVDDAAVLPDWTALPGVVQVDAPEVRELDARYVDTAEATLAHAGVAVRRREGGPDAGWHIKATRPDGRHEWHWPLDATHPAPGEDTAPAVPHEVAAALAAYASGPYLPLARIRNHRIAHLLRDAAGDVVAEVVDDHVIARNERTGAESTWREWEVELGPTAPADTAAFFAAADALVAAAGGRVAASDSKLARTLSL